MDNYGNIAHQMLVDWASDAQRYGMGYVAKTHLQTIPEVVTYRYECYMWGYVEKTRSGSTLEVVMMYQ